MLRHSISCFAGVCLVGFAAGCNRVDMTEYREIKPGQVTVTTQPSENEVAVDTESPKSTDPVSSNGTESEAGPSKTTEAATPATTPTPQTTEAATTVEPTVAEPIKVLIPEKEFSVVGPQDALRVTFEDIDLEKILDVKTITKDAPKYFPQWLKDLDKRRVRIRGYMRPAFEDTGLRAFTLTRDTSVCCFGPKPKVCYLIDTVMRKGESVDYIENRPFEVIGIFHIGDSIAPGELFTLDDAVVIAK